MKTPFVPAVLSLFALAAGTAPSSAQQTMPRPNSTHPNIVVFLVDDMGWQDTSLPFWTQTTKQNRIFHTPNMERLAAQGEMFTNAYACAVCSPSRVSLITGLSAARHHVTNWTLRFNQQTDAAHSRLNPPQWNVNGLSNSPDTPRALITPTLPQKLHEAGYETIIVGKGHLGSTETPGAEPKNLGFDVSVASSAIGAPGSFLGEHNYSARWRNGDDIWDVPGLEKYQGTDTFLTEALTIEANKAVNSVVASKKPFFLYLSHYAVHVPLEKDARFYQKYKNAGLDDNGAAYAAMVEGMDKSLGDVMDNLEKQGVANNTLFIFMSDNGGLSLYSRGDAAGTQNAPLRAGKGSPYEGGIRVPMIVKWPGVTKNGVRCETPVIIEDFFPTLLSAGQANIPANDGVDFGALLRDPQTPVKERALLWHFPNAWGEGGGNYAYYSVLRKGDWKLIYRYAPRTFELYKLRDDVGEKNNLAATQPKKVKELAAEMRRLLVGRNAQMPLDKATGQVVTLPGE